MSTYPLSTTAADLWGTSAAGVNNSDTVANIGYNAGSKVKSWIPFTVSLPQGVQITSATLKLTAAASRVDTVLFNMGCEDADNPSAPSDWTDLNGRVMTSAVLSSSITSYTSGTQYDYDITAAVQEVLDRSGWAFGNTLAVMIFDDGTAVGDFQRYAMFDNVSLTEPILEIVIPTFIPRTAGMV